MRHCYQSFDTPHRPHNRCCKCEHDRFGAPAACTGAALRPEPPEEKERLRAVRRAINQAARTRPWGRRIA